MSTRRRTEGMTLVEAALLVSLAGVVLAVFVPTFLRHLRTSKIEEASDTLARLAAAADTYYTTRQSGRRRCLPAAAGPFPPAPSASAVEVDLDAAEGAATWAALELPTERPLRFSYEFLPARGGCGVEVRPGEPLYTIVATGDLDGDGRRSRFERSATVDEAGRPRPLGVLYVADRVE